MDKNTCCLCKEGGHTASNCPDLYDPLKEGFYSGGGGGGQGHSHEDDEKIRYTIKTSKQLLIPLVK